jgi:formylglycine-generating enzyme required for sulfatase activity
MGTDKGFEYEGPAHKVTISPFWIDEHEVTIEDFAKFIEATGHKTDSEKLGWSGVFDVKTGEWKKVDGADWRHPDGPESTPDPNEPVCQVSYRDAEAYARWAGKRLPTEAEFEWASRGGKLDSWYWWGNELNPGGKFMANYWQGNFPASDSAEDGISGRAEVCSYPRNGFGLCDTAGNVWEWTQDWFNIKGHDSKSSKDPKGASEGNQKVLKGGSWLCSESYCTGYRIAARGKTEIDSGLNNLGFRCARDD